MIRESKRTKQVLISLVVSKVDIENEQKEKLLEFLKQNFSQGTKIGDRGYFV